jgi:hypothetical protein
MGRAAQIFIIMHVVWWKVDAYALTIARANNAIMQYRRRGLNSGVGCAHIRWRSQLLDVGG